MADAPWTPRAWKVARSAWIPAPPQESDPAMVSATGAHDGCVEEWSVFTG